MNSPQTNIKPRILPRDFVDVLLGLFVACPTQVVPVFLLPSGVVFFAARAGHASIESSLLLAAATYIVIGLMILGFVIWSLRIDSEGIHFVRLFGRPRLLRWEDISDIAPAARGEVVAKGWFGPAAMRRELTPTLSALNHFRIRWGSEYCYFPPDDVEQFLDVIGQFRKPETLSP